MPSTTVRLDGETLDRIDRLASATKRSRSFLIQDAVARYLEYEEWFVRQVRIGLDQADAGNFATAEEVAARFEKWESDAD